MTSKDAMKARSMGDIDIFGRTFDYHGVQLLGVQPPEILEGLKDWQTREDDVYLSLYPKAGSHWVYEIVTLILNDARVDEIDRSHWEFALDMALAHSVDGLETITHGYKAMADWPSPRAMVSYALEEFTPEQIKKRKVVVWNRNPKDVANSYYKFLGPTLPPAVREWPNFLTYFLSENMFGGSWFRHVKGWWKHRDEPNFLFCKYEDFQKDLPGQIKRMADFLGKPLSDEMVKKIAELTQIEGMRKTYAKIEEKMGEPGKTITRMFGQLPYLRKGKVGGWKENFTVAQNEYFDKVYREQMDGTDIVYEFEI